MIDATLFLLLLFCHWLGDFTHFSRPYMLAAKKFGTPIKPISDHATVHACLMSIVVIFYMDADLRMAEMAIGTFVIEYSSHLLIDVLKGKLNRWFPSLQNPANYFHWYVFGLDQLAHIAVIVLITKIISQ